MKSHTGESHSTAVSDIAVLCLKPIISGIPYLEDVANIFPSQQKVDGEETSVCRGAGRAPLAQGVPLPGQFSR